MVLRKEIWSCEIHFFFSKKTFKFVIQIETYFPQSFIHILCLIQIMSNFAWSFDAGERGFHIIFNRDT